MPQTKIKNELNYVIWWFLIHPENFELICQRVNKTCCLASRLRGFINPLNNGSNFIRLSASTNESLLSVQSRIESEEWTVTFTGFGPVRLWGHALRSTASHCCWADCSASGDGDYQIKLAGTRRRHANTGLSSEQIQFHSINIDVLLSPANGLTLPSGHWYRWYTDHYCSYVLLGMG